MLVAAQEEQQRRALHVALSDPWTTEWLFGTDPWGADEERSRRAGLWLSYREQHGHPPLLPPYTSGDLTESYETLEPREARKARAVLQHASEGHTARHAFLRHPLCPQCCHRDIAERRLVHWLLRNPGKTPPDVLDERHLAEMLAPEPERGHFQSVAELRDLPAPRDLFAGLIPQGSVGYLSAPGGVGKTLLTICLALHLVTARDWHGHAIDCSWEPRVLFVAGEGWRAFPMRIAAWETHHGPLDDEAEQGLVVRSGGVDLFAGGAAYQELLAKVREMQPDLVALDTLQRHAGAADQNSASDMSVITARLAALRAAGGERTTVMVLAHSTKAGADLRGSSAIFDDADFVLTLARSDDRVRLEISKMKDGPTGHVLDLQMVESEGSALLLPAGTPQAWFSDSLAERIKGVLFATRGQDALTSAQLLSHLREDGTDKPASRPGAAKALGQLVDEGVVECLNPGKRPQHYRLHADHYPPDVKVP
jgi:hypothetical protein